MALYVFISAWSSVHLDLARDMRVALDIKEGIEFPLLGPIMAGHIKLGPAWYYFLALLQILGNNWFGAIIILALFCSFQFPIAYLAGKEWRGKTTGLIFSALLLLPSWSTFEQLNPTHTQITAVLVLLLLLCMIRFCRRNEIMYFLGAFFVFSLSIHAHPSTIALIPVPMAMVAVAAKRKLLTVGHSMLALVFFFIPFSPWIWNEIGNGFISYQNIVRYSSSENTRKISFQNIFPLALQTVWGGLQYWMSDILNLPRWQKFTIDLLWSLIVAFGVLGSVRVASKNDKSMQVALALTIFAFFVIVAIRGYFPYYMTTVLRILLYGIIAAGCADLLVNKCYRILTVILIIFFACICYSMVAEKTIDSQKNGNWSFSFLPMFHVLHEGLPHQPLAIMPAYAMPASGKFLCEDATQGLHGAYAVHLIHGYAIEKRFACNAGDVSVGGSNSSAIQWVGASRAMLNVAHLRPTFTIGPFGFFSIQKFIHAADLFEASRADFPPIISDKKFKTIRYEVPELSENQTLAIVNLGFSFIPDPEIKVRLSGNTIEPIASDRTTSFYKCKGCNLIEIEIISTNPERIEILIF